MDHELVSESARAWEALQSRARELEAERRQVEIALYQAIHDTPPPESPRRLQRRLTELLDAIEEVRDHQGIAAQRLAHAKSAAIGELWPVLAAQALPLLERLRAALEGVCRAQEEAQTLAFRCQKLGVNLPLGLSAFDNGNTASRLEAVQQALATLGR